MKDSTRAKSSIQEKRIAKAMGGRQVVGSGSTPFLKGDVVVDKLFIEAKTKMNPSQSITVKKGWIDKAKEQSLAMRKEDYAIAVSFGDPKEYYLIEDTLMEDLYKSIDKEALRIVRAEFIGKTSMGFITGHIYTIETACKMVKRCKTSRADPVPCLCVYDKNSKAWCPYSSMEKVLENWRLL